MHSTFTRFTKNVTSMDYLFSKMSSSRCGVAMVSRDSTAVTVTSSYQSLIFTIRFMRDTVIAKSKWSLRVTLLTHIGSSSLRFSTYCHVPELPWRSTSPSIWVWLNTDRKFDWLGVTHTHHRSRWWAISPVEKLWKFTMCRFRAQTLIFIPTLCLACMEHINISSHINVFFFLDIF